MTSTMSRPVDRDRPAGSNGHEAGRRVGSNAETPTYPEWFARTWAGTAGALDRCPYNDPLRRLTDAMGEAGTRYPGPVGELVRRELRAFVDFGYRFDGSGLVPRLVDELLGDATPRTVR